MSIKHSLKNYVADYPDFPKEGIIFRDISPLLKDKFIETIDEIANLLQPKQWSEIDTLAGIDSRGFIIASALAYKLNKQFIMIRKPGKLPGKKVSKEYQLEYGKNKLEMQISSSDQAGKIVIIDDVLATGGTLHASCELCEAAGFKVIALLTLINLTFLNDFSFGSIKPLSIIQY